MISAMAAPSFMTVSPPDMAGRFDPAHCRQLEQDLTAR
jgi:hypothetical protein